MSCLYPIDAWRAKRLNENGKREIVFRRADGYEDMALQVPCGKCAGCRADKALAWSIRCYQESSLHDQNSFLTLTYNDENLPDSLVKTDLQKFFRALRDQGQKVRYYACGEYGDISGRPHYHACIFGTDFRDGREYAINNELYAVPRVTDLWGKGNVLIADFTMATACYVAGYVGKKINKPEDDSFQLMSRKPGIGFDWLRKHVQDIVKTDSVIIEGREFPVPPQYIRWCEENMENELHGVKLRRAERFKNLSIEKVIDKRREHRAKEVYLNQKVQHQKRKEKI